MQTKGTSNKYATRKTLAQGLLDVSLLMANASQLKAVIEVGEHGQQFYYALLVLIGVSIVIQVVVGIVLIVLGGMELKTAEEKKRAHVLNNVSVGLIMVVTVINTFITAFGIKLSDDASGNQNATI